MAVFIIIIIIVIFLKPGQGYLAVRAYSTGHNNDNNNKKKTYTQVHFFFLLSHRKYHKPTANYILSTPDNPGPVR